MINSGEFWSVGGHGRCWQSSSFGVGSVACKAGYFVGHGGSITLLGNGFRTEGFPVRCVQAFTFVAISFLFLIFAGDSDKSGVWQSD